MLSILINIELLSIIINESINNNQLYINYIDALLMPYYLPEIYIWGRN